MTDGAEQRLFEVLRGVDRPWLVERSAKIIGGNVRDNRMLVSFPRGALGPGPSRQLMRMCQSLGAPKEGLDYLLAHQSGASTVHFGLEPEQTGPLYKCYIEFAPGDAPEPELAFLALKWCAVDGRFALSRYWRRDDLSARKKQALVSDCLPDGRIQEMFLKMLAMGKGAPLLEVDETSGPRRSLDLNLADCGWTVGEQADCLRQGLKGCPGAAVYIDLHAEEKLGHIAAGTARDGRAFATVYHGAHFTKAEAA